MWKHIFDFFQMSVELYQHSGLVLCGRVFCELPCLGFFFLVIYEKILTMFQ